MAITFAAGVSLLEDTVVSVAVSSSGDTGVIGSYGSAADFEMDKVSVKSTGATADHSGGQNPIPITRFTKYDSQLDLEMKMFVGAAQLPMMQIGFQIQVIGVATINSVLRTVTMSGIITDCEMEFAGPSTVKVTVKPYACAGAPALVIS